MQKLLLVSLIIMLLVTGICLVYSNRNHQNYGTVLGSNSSSKQDPTTYAPEGYSNTLVTTKVGKFRANIYKAKLSKVNVKTVAANKETCKKDCPTKTLKQYATENNAIAAMNATYFCPPDYSNCKGKINSFDFAFYNSNKGVWLNKGALKWNKTAIATFKDKKAKFYMDTSKFGGGSVNAALSNFPALVHNNEIVVEKGDVQPYQRNKGTKGFVGTDGTNIYLVLVPNTTITEVAYVARALGMSYALNVDGGGSSAMYADGYYKVGPGRLLPNAIVLTR